MENRFLIGVAMLALACTSKEGSNDVIPPNRLVIHSDGAEYTSVSPAALNASFGEMTEYELSASGRDANGRTWGFLAHLPGLEAGTATVAVKKGATAPGEATLTLTNTDDSVVEATAGNIEFAPAAGGSITGTATATPSTLSGTFEGSLVVNCWVTREALNSGDGNGTSGGDGPPPLVIDEHFVTEQCQAVKAWAK
jgi:hypothetical protein